MTIIKRSVAVVVRGPEAGTFLVVKRPDDPADPLAGVWGFPAVTLADGEDERAAVIRAGRDKLGVELAPGGRLGRRAPTGARTCWFSRTTRPPSPTASRPCRGRTHR